MTELLTPGHFRPHLDKVFRVRGGHHALTLTKVDARQVADWEREVVPREPFNLIFRGPPGDVLPEGFHAMEVEDGPSFEFYLMPIHTPARDRQDYQAVFN
jgi:hypothetical protein